MVVTRENLNLILLSVWCLVFPLCIGQDCESKIFCDQCIQELNCFWCVSPKTGTTHCLAKTKLSSCDAGHTEDPRPSYLVLEEKALTETKQISPQIVQLKLRKNQKHVISFRYKQSQNYPVDLYYIMDLSHSMEPSKARLAELGEQLAEEMKRKTTDFQIGFGSFVDKLTLPYVNTHPDALRSPCTGCASPYSFKNHLSLMQDASLFSRKVKETRMSGNLDSPEGGLDAIMQAIVCKKEIGWRPNARHLLVMSTDAVSHIAGDGKLGGVIEPNDATCHLLNDTYTHGLIYDYPSVSQVNYVARQNNINLIFAIVLKENKDPDNLKGHYQAMSSVIENSKTGTLDGDSDNVVKFISDIYDQIRDSVRITSDAQRDVSVNINSNCPNFVDGGCTSVKPGQVIEFNATIEPLACHKDAKSNKKLITIKPEGLADSLVVELEVLCECACAANKQKSHSSCNHAGDLECGTCRCNPGRNGIDCRCNGTESRVEDPSLCVKPGGKNESCSGQGKCVCDECVCKKGPEEFDLIYGKYCECDNFTCPLRCSGRGNCECGTCDCHDGWKGSGCECSTEETPCIPPNEPKIPCSGHGDCVCGECQCTSDGDKKYSGKHCEVCISCTTPMCDELQPCVECQVFQSGKYANSTDCTENCTKIFNMTVVPQLEEKTGEGVHRCRGTVEQNCQIAFEYSYDEDKNLYVTAAKSKICTEPQPLLGLILGVIGSVLLIGILTLIAWKVVTTVHDKNEYARFLDERNQTKWSAGENPLYKPGTSHFQNPAYMRASHRVSVGAAASAAAKKQAATTGEEKTD